jgi:hypothetical protein
MTIRPFTGGNFAGVRNGNLYAESFRGETMKFYLQGSKIDDELKELNLRKGEYIKIEMDGSGGVVHVERSTESPQSRWQRRNGYVSKSYKLKQGLVEDFAEACDRAGVTQAAQLSKMMNEFIQKN